MIIPSIFEMNSIKDQLALLSTLSSHIDFEAFKEEEINPDFERLLTKMDNTAKNLKEKYENLKKLLEN